MLKVPGIKGGIILSTHTIFTNEANNQEAKQPLDKKIKISDESI